jgi:hypothetical protein
MSATVVPVREPSPVDAVTEAIAHTRRHLFPFQFERWLTLGLVAFLDQCGRGGVGGAIPGGPPGPGVPSAGSGVGHGMSDVGAWFTAHLALILGAAAGALAVGLLLVAVILWIQSRATFVYIDDVVTGRAELTRPWRAHAERAQSYFAWRFGLAAALLVALAVLVVLAVAGALLISHGGARAAGGAVLLITLVPVFIAVLVGGGLASLGLRDFVAPLQMHSGLACGPAVRILLSLVRAHPLPFLLYLLLKVALGVVQGIVLVFGACVTLCCILIPVVTQTVLQPLFFFERAWPLYLLRQMGYDLFDETRRAPPWA